MTLAHVYMKHHDALYILLVLRVFDQDVIESVRLGQRLSRVVLDYILYLYVSVRG